MFKIRKGAALGGEGYSRGVEFLAAPPQKKTQQLKYTTVLAV